MTEKKLIKNIKIEELNTKMYFGNGFRVIINGRNGKSYDTIYTRRPTVEEIKEDFLKDRRIFTLINKS